MTDQRDRLLATFDLQLRGEGVEPLPLGAVAELDGPLERITGLGTARLHLLPRPRRAGGRELDELIARQVRFFGERDEAVEWKLYGHDLPADLAERLRAAGFVPEDAETVVIAPVAAIVAETRSRPAE